MNARVSACIAQLDRSPNTTRVYANLLTRFLAAHPKGSRRGAVRFLSALATTEGAFRPALAAVNHWLRLQGDEAIERAELELFLRPSVAETAEDADHLLALCSSATRAAVLLAKATGRPLPDVLKLPRAGALALTEDEETREAVSEHLAFSPSGPWLFPGQGGRKPVNPATVRRELAKVREGPRVTVRAIVRG